MCKEEKQAILSLETELKNLESKLRAGNLSVVEKIGKLARQLDRVKAFINQG